MRVIEINPDTLLFQGKITGLMGTSGLESCLKSTAHDTSTTTQEAIQHFIVVALQIANTFFSRKSPTTGFDTSFLLACNEEEDGFPLFRVAKIEAQLALFFSRGYQGWIPMLLITG